MDDDDGAAENGSVRGRRCAARPAMDEERATDLFMVVMSPLQRFTRSSSKVQVVEVVGVWVSGWSGSG